MDRLKTLAQDIMNGTWQLQLAAAAFLCMFLILLFTLINQLGSFSHYVSSNDTLASERQVVATTSGDKVVNQIVETPIFGTYVEQKVEKINTTLDLLGIMMTTDPSNRLAFIAEPNKDAFVFREGDEISTGLKVHRIYSDKVTLLRYGKPETLYIAWEDALASGQMIKPSVKRSPSTNRVNRNRGLPENFNREQYIQRIKERMGRVGRNNPRSKNFPGTNRKF